MMNETCTPRERVLRALSHQEPDRVPFAFGFGPTAEARATIDTYLEPMGTDYAALAKATEDLRRVSAPYVGPTLPERTSYWGIRYKAVAHEGGEYNEFEFYPLAGVETIAQMDAHPWPKPEWFDYSDLRETLGRVGEDGRYAIRYGSSNPFEIFCWMMGLEEAMMKLVLQPELVARGLEHITTFFCEFQRRGLEAADGGIDLCFTADDLGGQHGLLLSRDMYRDVIQPFHVKLHATIHEYGARSLYHSDGSVIEILPDLIDAGVDVLEAVQVDAAGMDPEALKAAAGDRLGFHGGVSVQQLLPHGTAEEVRDEVARLKKVLGAGGGYICAPSHAVQVGTPPENVIAMVETAVEKPLQEILADAV